MFWWTTPTVESNPYDDMYQKMAKRRWRWQCHTFAAFLFLTLGWSTLTAAIGKQPFFFRTEGENVK